jgi:hypothetical protein
MSEPNNVKRYDVTDIGRVWDCHIVMREDPDGDWVLYQEYENLQREHEELKEAIQALLSEVKYIEGR